MAKQEKSKKSIPRSVSERPDRKEVRTGQEHRDGKPSWRFSTADKAGPFPWPSDGQKRAEILDKLHDLDSMHWSEIAGPVHHSISVDKLSSDAQKRLTEISQDDIDEVFSFRLSGKQRLICIRSLDIAKILWYDPEHLVCISTKKHT